MSRDKNIIKKSLYRFLDNSARNNNEILYVGSLDGIPEYSELKFDNLRDTASSQGFNLISVQELIRRIIDSRQLSYLLPSMQRNAAADLDLSEAYKSIWKSLHPSKALPQQGAFVHIKDGWTSFSYLVTDSLSPDEALNTFCIYLKSYYNSYDEPNASRFGLIYDSEDSTAEELPKDEFADRCFEIEIQNISVEIRERIHKLRLYGVSELAIKSLFKEEEKLSRLVITDDYQIILPDYGNMEIKMEPLPKAVYFLYLRHPEGLMFKELPGYHDEFMEIYRRLTNRRDAVALRSAERVLDPTNNSINEKCSRIREAFISRFDDNLACKYYITHYHHYKKHIKLDRSLVDLGPLSDNYKH